VCIGTSLSTGDFVGVGTELYVGGTSNLADVCTTGEVSVPQIRIRGGADIAEPFDFRDDGLIEPGMVVARSTRSDRAGYASRRARGARQAHRAPSAGSF
jgi:hypothetical protein